MSQDKWHLSRSVSVSHLVTTAALIFGALIYITDIGKDIAVLQANQNNMQLQIIDMQTDNKEMFARIDNKLDRMIEIIHSTPIR
jgi:hypothetical protein